MEECLASLEQLDYSRERLEVIIINDGSTDNTKSIINKYVARNPHFICLDTEAVGPGKARNMGISRATGEYVAFADADCALDSRWLEELLAGFINGSIAGVGGSQRAPQNATPFEEEVHAFLTSIRFVGEYIKLGEKLRPAGHLSSCNSMYRKAVVDSVGGFDEELWPGEDVDLDYRITRQGYKLMFNPRAAVRHHRPRDLRGFFRMMVRYGCANMDLIKKHGFFRRLQLVPVLEVFLLAGWAVLLAFYLYIGIALALAILLGAATAFALKHGWKRGLNNLKLLIITLVAFSIGNALCLFSRGRRS